MESGLPAANGRHDPGGGGGDESLLGLRDHQLAAAAPSCRLICVKSHAAEFGRNIVLCCPASASQDSRSSYWACCSSPKRRSRGRRLRLGLARSGAGHCRHGCDVVLPGRRGKARRSGRQRESLLGALHQRRAKRRYFHSGVPCSFHAGCSDGFAGARIWVLCVAPPVFHRSRPRGPASHHLVSELPDLIPPPR